MCHLYSSIRPTESWPVSIAWGVNQDVVELTVSDLILISLDEYIVGGDADLRRSYN